MTKFYALKEAHFGRLPCTEYKDRGLGMPGIQCVGLPGCCGVTWAHAMSRLPIEPEPGRCIDDEFGPCVTADIYQKKAEKTRRELNLPEDFYLEPGVVIGKLQVKCTRSKGRSMDWPSLKGPIVTDELRDAILSGGLTGFIAMEVIVRKSAAWRFGPLPGFTEIVVTGRGGRAITDAPIELKPPCPVCGRSQANRRIYRKISLDEGQWDGSDIFHFDDPYNITTYVTQRWVDAVPESRFDGFRYYLAGELMEIRNSVRS
jgi:Protein of unknown function (Gmx_para_CXXCG)